MSGLRSTARRPHVVIVDEVPTPYRAPVYRSLLETGELDASFEVWFCGHAGGFESWRDLDLDFPHGFLRGWDIQSRRANKDTYRLNPEVVPRLLGARPDVLVIGGWVQPTCLLAAGIARALRIPYVVASESHANHPRSSFAKLVGRAVFAPVARGAAASMPAGSAARDYLLAMGVDPESVFIRPNACDDRSLATAIEAARRNGRAEAQRAGFGDMPIVAFAGRLVSPKGIDVLLDALAQLEYEGTDVACLLAGDGSERHELSAKSEKLGLRHVRFLGELKPDELAAIYGAADVFCLPSFDEPWGVVVNEAMAAGLPVVASHAVGASRDMIEQGANGYEFAPGDPTGLAKALRAALDLDRQVAGDVSRARAGEWGIARARRGMKDAVEHALRSCRRP